MEPRQVDSSSSTAATAAVRPEDMFDAKIRAGARKPPDPVDYSEIRAYERALPQHNLSLPYPGGQNGHYLRFTDRLWGHGLNNILQEVILHSHLAYAANRSYVFEDYEWSRTPAPWTIYDLALRPKRIPLNAFIAGPTAGAPYSATAAAPRAISAEWWDVVCPSSRRHTLTSEGAPHGPEIEGAVIMEWWVKKLGEYEQYSCVEITSPLPIFDKYLFGTANMLSLWPQLAASPILTAYSWSPLVHSAVTRNFALLRPTDPAQLSDHAAPASLTGLVAIHLRRGDYSRHCPHLARWGASYMGLNQFPALPDRFAPPPAATPGDTPSAETAAYYRAHCYPSVAQIVARLHAVREAHPSLTRVYALSNGWPRFLGELRAALAADGWADTITRVHLDAEQAYVGMAVDMAVAEKAEVFVGNGFSSLSANVVMLRMAKGADPRTNHFL
ncbi:hypothetical protein HWV62_5752 [Athelia sp. TMB]|nr:hypothetical protein HWV62_5752 [Athelia sp. TMB]